MDLLNGKIKLMYFRYLSAAFGSAMITSVYSIVDTAMVGQYHGPEGTAALAVVAPVWNIIYSLGSLMGIGGSVIFSTKRGSEKKDGSENQYFTAAVIGSAILALLAWAALLCFERPILTFFGANESLLVLARKYMRPIQWVFPLFLLNQMLAAFLRNDGNPGLATLGVLAGGAFNVFGDHVFVFTCRMGIYGAGLVTAIGSGISFVMMLTHFFSRKNTLRLMKVERLPHKLQKICVTGFSTFFIDVAMGILTVLFNRQIMKYLGMARSFRSAPLFSAVRTASGRRRSPSFPGTSARAKAEEAGRPYGWRWARRRFSAHSGRRSAWRVRIFISVFLWHRRSKFWK